MFKQNKITTPKKYKIIILISWLISLCLLLYSPSDLSTSFMSLSLINVFICTLIFFFYQKNIFKNIIITSLTSLFIISMIITHFQVALTHVFGYNIDNEWFYNFLWADESTGNLSVSISSIGLISFYVGHIYCQTYSLSSKNLKYSWNYKQLITILTYLSIIFYLLFFITSGSYKYGNYFAGDQLPISNYFFNFFNILIKSALIIKLFFLHKEIEKISSLRKYISFIGLPISIIVLWHVVFSIFVGDRGPVIIFGVLYFGLYSVRILKKKYNLFVILSFFLLSIFFLVLGDSRTRYGSESFLSKIDSSDYESRYSRYFLEDNIPALSTLELALSVRCLNHSIANVPNNYDFKYGEYQLKQLLATVPFLVGTLDKYLIKGKKNEASTADFITFLIQGDDPQYGDATTPVADLYLDFGTIGVILGFFIFGRFSKKSDLIVLSRANTSLFNWICIMFYWSGAIYLGRATFLYYIQSIIQIYVFIVILNSILKIKTK